MEEKISKLINAVYDLLEFFPEGEPLKAKIKEKTLPITEGLVSENIFALLDYLELARKRGWIGAMNFLIIKNEYERLLRCPSISLGVPRNDDKKFTARQEKIINIIKQKGSAQVMDFQAVLKDITKRTIRRDLDELLKIGQIERDGTFNQIVYKIKMSH